MKNIDELNYQKHDIELSFTEWVSELDTVIEWF